MSRNRAVHMIRGADQHRIDLGFIIQHLPIIPILLGLIPEPCGPVFFQGGRHFAVVDITQGVNVFVSDLANVSLTLTVYTNGGNVYLVARCDISGAAKHVAGHDHENGSAGSSLDKISAADFCFGS